MPLFNPGSGPFPTAHEDAATANIAVFAADVCGRWGYQLVSFVRRPDKDYGNGHYAWELAFLLPNGKHHTCEVQMFGVSRGYGVDQNPLPFPEPRIYVDGSSWVWEFAVSNAAAEVDRERRFHPGAPGALRG